MGGGGLAEKVRIGEEDFFAHGFSRMDTDFWVTCSGLFFLAIEPSSCLAIQPENEERGSRLLKSDFHRRRREAEVLAHLFPIHFISIHAFSLSSGKAFSPWNACFDLRGCGNDVWGILRDLVMLKVFGCQGVAC